MITLLVNALIVLTVTATIGWSVFTFQRSAEIVSLSQRNAARMEQVASSFRASLRPVELDGTLRAPLGDPFGPPIDVARNGNTAVNPAEQVCIDEAGSQTKSHQYQVTCRRMVIPSWVISDTRTPWGAQYGYCPLSVDAIGPAGPGLTPTDGIVRSGSSTSYAVKVLTARGRDFVYQSVQPAIQVIEGGVQRTTTAVAEDLVGFVVSPAPFGDSGVTPLCSEVAKLDGSWVVMGQNGSKPTYAGTVTPILTRGVGTGQVASQGEVTLFVAPGPSGAGTGDNPANAMAFADALDLWHVTPWRSTTIRMAPTTYTFSSADVVPGGGGVPRLFLATSSPGRTLRLASDGAASIASGSGEALDLVMGVDGRLDGVSLGKGVGLVAVGGSRVRVTQGTLRYVRVDGGELDLGGGTQVVQDDGRSSYSAIDVPAGRLVLSGGTFGLSATTMPSSGVGINVYGGQVLMAGTNVTMDLAPGARSMSMAALGRFSASPTSSGSMPSLTVSSSAGSLTVQVPPAGETGVTKCDSGNTGTCEASCLPQSVAESGGCFYEGSATEPPALAMSVRGDAFEGGSASNASKWVCRWNPGSVYNQGVTGISSVGQSDFPHLRASASCRPNPVMVAPGTPVNG